MMSATADDPTAAGYTPDDLERFLVEPGRSARATFERDRARIVHSASLRRLAAKTQVVGPSSNDFTRNRLTHTLEVAQIGRDLANVLGCDPDVVEAACLAHDLGHPPFGHNGEAALNAAAADAGGFEGNAQTLRLLTRLEAKTVASDGTSLGLNLTRAVLDAACKYPWTLGEAPPPRGRHGDGLPRAVRKFGVYDDDLAIFTWMRRGAPSAVTCIEAQIMDFADDVAYSVHDVEDAIVAGRVQPGDLEDPGLRSDVWETVRDWYDLGLDPADLEAAYDRMSSSDAWPRTPYDGTRPQLAGLKNLTSRLINRFCLAVQEQVEQNGSAPSLVRYAADLPVPDDTAAEIAVLKGITAHLVMKADDRVAAHAGQRELLTELVGALSAAGPDALEPVFRPDLAVAVDDAARLRVVIDQVASFTDPSAVQTHRRLVRTA
ncbi:MAG: deoxyguanosinetriphosphate triphosphohydrolase [Propionibacteriales bacterium]|nr:deoxyguanosinetriphosphate triphosphohydrolase [Propionibacteriales bacterium]